MGILTYNDKTFLMDGKPYTIVSGAMHYFRIPREYWHDRLLKLKECGFNTVETYTCWNLHEKEEGVFDFSGMLDVAAYADEAASLGLNLILRPGPYICSEWEFGGLPAWLLKYGDMAIRCNDPLYIEKVRRYYHALFDELRPRLSTNGGNIIMVQIENEYGSYGNDKDYLRAVVDIYRECGVDVTLFTSDGACWWMLGGGTLPEYLCVANFGSHPRENFAMLEKFRPDQPKMCGEYFKFVFCVSPHSVKRYVGVDRRREVERPCVSQFVVPTDEEVTVFDGAIGSLGGFARPYDLIAYKRAAVTVERDRIFRSVFILDGCAADLLNVPRGVGCIEALKHDVHAVPALREP